MYHRITLPAALAAALTFGAVPASAAAPNQAGAPDLVGLQQAKISLDQAISAVESQSGGNATRATFRTMNGQSGYVVSVFAANGTKEYLVDPQSGAVRPQATTSTMQTSEEAMDKADLSALRGAKSTLPQAVSMAEQQNGGKAIAAQIEKRNNKVAYNIQIVQNGQLSSVWVDPMRGQITG
jgi:uncharacterized membrane protein YkoI